MFRNPEEIRRRISEIVEKFRQKGATSPEKAMTLQELDLPPRFEQAMHRRLGQTGIFLEVSGKYYLNEERLKQIQEQRANSSSGSYGGGMRQRPPTWLRYAGILLMLPIGIIVAVVLYFFFVTTGSGYYPGEFLIILLVVMLIVFAARMMLWRSRRRYWGQQRTGNGPYA
ncbi:MAG: hypothetical protein ABSA79_06620 [Candidatus Bathyarchaeia archaeon]|jgi:hypothetical protein